MVDTPLTVMGPAVAPLCTPEPDAPCCERQVAVYLAMATPLLAPAVKVTLSEPVLVFVELSSEQADRIVIESNTVAALVNVTADK